MLFPCNALFSNLLLIGFLVKFDFLRAQSHPQTEYQGLVDILHEYVIEGKEGGLTPKMLKLYRGTSFFPLRNQIEAFLSDNPRTAADMRAAERNFLNGKATQIYCRHIGLVQTLINHASGDFHAINLVDWQVEEKNLLKGIPTKPSSRRFQIDSSLGYSQTTTTHFRKPKAFIINATENSDDGSVRSTWNQNFSRESPSSSGSRSFDKGFLAPVKLSSPMDYNFFISRNLGSTINLESQQPDVVETQVRGVINGEIPVLLQRQMERRLPTFLLPISGKTLEDCFAIKVTFKVNRRKSRGP